MFALSMLALRGMGFAVGLSSSIKAENLMPSQIDLLTVASSIPVKVYEPERQAPAWEQAVLVIWLFALTLPLIEFSLIRYAGIAVTLGLFCWYNRETVPMLLSSWPLLLLPAMGALSVFWSDYPDAAARTAILLMLTPVFLVTIASRVRVIEFLRALMLCGSLAALFCVPYFSTLSEGGPYPQKNILAYQMMIVTLVSLAVFLNATELLVFRLIAAVSACLAFAIQLLADSATSLLLALLGAAFLLGIKFIWLGAARVAHLRLLIFSAVVVLLLSGVLVVAMMPYNTILSDFLKLVGKDASLTGRTDIWIAAEMVTEEHPWIGVGYEGFWHRNTGLAQTLNELTHTPPGVNISFHSTFWEVRVHLGLIGLGLLIFAMVWAGLRTLKLWLQDNSMGNSTLLLFYFIILASCFTESYLAGSFGPIYALFYFGSLAAFKARERKFLGIGYLTEQRS